MPSRKIAICPAWWEYLNIRLFTDRAKWTEPQRKMMRRTRFVHATRWGLAFTLLLITGIAFQQWYRWDRRERLQRQVVSAVNLLKNSEGSRARKLIEDLAEPPPEMVKRQLEDQFAEATLLQRLPLAFALAEYGDVQLDFLLEQVREASPQDFDNFVLALKHALDKAKSAIYSKALTCTEKQDWNYKTRLAVLGLYLGDTSIAAEMLRGEPDKNSGPDFGEDSEPARFAPRPAQHDHQDARRATEPTASPLAASHGQLLFGSPAGCT